MIPFSKSQGNPAFRITFCTGFFGPFLIIVLRIKSLFSLLLSVILGSTKRGKSNVYEFLAYSKIYSWQFFILAWLSKFPSVTHTNCVIKLVGKNTSSHIFFRCATSLSFIDIKISPLSANKFLAINKRE